MILEMFGACILNEVAKNIKNTCSSIGTNCNYDNYDEDYDEYSEYDEDLDIDEDYYEDF